MRLSQYFLPTLKENPKEAEVISHRLMLRSGMIRQQTSGIYSWLPLGKKVLDKVCAIIREEQERIGALEILMPTIQSADLWHESNRYDNYGLEMLRIKDRQERDLLYGPTNEEMVTDIFRSYVRSYKDLPLNLYQIQWKFRDEIRPRFGVMRSREFLMKDAYSFDRDYKSSQESYNRMFVSYLRTFHRVGLKAIPVRSDTGPIGGDLSHEFIILAKTGESIIFYDRRFLQITVPHISVDLTDGGVVHDIVRQWTSLYAATEEMHNQGDWDKIPEDNRVSERGIEVGHIFHFGTKYSAPMGAKVMGEDGKEHVVFMGSYGIGPSRLVAAIIEALHDEKGIVWPKSIAPFDFGIVNLKPDDTMCNCTCETLYQGLIRSGFDPLLDDKSGSPGSKFAMMDLIGLPIQVIIGPKSVQRNEIEIKDRKTGFKEIMTVEAALNRYSTVHGQCHE